MTTIKQLILTNLCYTPLVYGRINKKLNIKLSEAQIESFIHNILSETEETFFIKTGKNYYVSNPGNNLRITINSSTFRIITVDKIQKK